MRVHFIGIGGIGVSALAQHYLKLGHQVSGSDLVSSEITNLLKKKGAKIVINQTSKSAKFIRQANLVVYSPAITQNHPELKLAQQLKIKSQSYPQALGDLTKDYLTIAVCGTHGKSTTTAMLSLLLIKAGFDPTVIVGTRLKEFNNSNYHFGKSQILVIEADEHFASFLNYWPDIIILTSLDPDHLDYYKNFQNYLKAFKQFIGHLSYGGILIANKDDQDIVRLQKQIKLPIKIKNYSLKQREVKKLSKILKIPGEHNIANSLAVLTLARLFNIPDKITFQTLSQYKGAWRRFEEYNLKINKNLKFKIINDYAHHPTEIKVTLEAARQKYFNKKIWCVFQPHQYQRTYYLFNDFVKVFRQCPINHLIITDIYSVAGRENKKIKIKVNSKKLVKEVNKSNVIYLPKNKILLYLTKNFAAFDVLIVMGAGDIYDLSKKILKYKYK